MTNTQRLSRSIFLTTLLIVASTISYAQGGDPRNANRSESNGNSSSSSRNANRSEGNDNSSSSSRNGNRSKSNRNSSSSRNGALSRERQRRERAEAEAAEARAAKERAERESREKVEVWMVSLLRNRTDNPITFSCSCSGERTLGPGEGRVYTTKKDPVTITFNNGDRERRIKLDSTPIIGHYPTEADKEKAKLNYFGFKDGTLTIFSHH